MLKKFIEDNNIDLKAVERMRHRLFIVGRFNQSKKGELYPDIYLFTNRPAADLSQKYLANFTDQREMLYEAFVQCLRPALAERLEFEGGTPETQIPKVRQMVPRDNKEADEGAAVVDPFHPLFQRGISTTTQNELVGIRPRLALGLDSVGDRQSAGKGIFKLIRRNLHIFSKFQPRTHEIVEAMSKLLNNCAREAGMPAYAGGGALPGGFPEKLIDFVYAEDSRTTFTTGDLDFSTPPWDQLHRDEKSREMFCKVVNAFRNALLNIKREEYGMFRFEGRSLDHQARSVISDDLAGDFIEAREAYNGLRQVLRSKALISTVLEWVLSAYYNLPEVTKLPKDTDWVDKDQAVEKAILHCWDKEGKWTNTRVAEPVARPTVEERDRFSRELTANFERLLLVLFADKDSVTSKIDNLPQALRGLAKKLRETPTYVEALAGIAAPAAGGGTDTQEAFIEACKIVLLDVLCPTLFQQPMLSLDMLQQYFEQETMSAYLAAIFLAKDNKDQIRLIGQHNLKYFQERIDKTTQKIRDSGEINERLLGEFFELIVSKDVRRQLTEGVRVLREAHVILSNAPLGSSAGAISAVRPDPSLLKSRVLENTRLEPEEVNASLHSLVEKMVASDTRVIVAAGSGDAIAEKTAAARPAPSPVTSTGFTNASAAVSQARAPEVSQTREGEKEKAIREGHYIRYAASKAVAKVVDDFFKEHKPEGETVQTPQISTLADAATQVLLQDDGFMGKVRSDVRAFEQVLFLIYQRYNENTEKKTFRNRVERLTLINMMLLFQKELGLGTVSSNLYHMLLDLVQHLDPENPDPGTFIREKSLTVYFDNAKLETVGNLSGITNLRNTLKAQAYENLRETVDFVSELWGVKYLMDRVKDDRQAEVVVINANAKEFLDWLKEDNVSAGRGGGRLRSGFLVDVGQKADESIQPGLVYLTDAAFSAAGDAKAAFLNDLQAIQLQSGGLGFLMPPICIATSYEDGTHAWQADGKRWADLAKHVPVPVVIVGPSAFLNSSEDHFRTYLPAGYIFGAHFLSRPSQAIEIRSVSGEPSGRFRQIGYGAMGMPISLDRVLWPVSSDDKYAFSVDYYLYIVLTLLATAARHGGATPNAGPYYSHFYRPNVGPKDWQSTDVIDKALIGDDALRFSMSSEIGGQNPFVLPSVNCAGATAVLDGPAPYNVDDIAWFNLARRQAGLP